MAMSECHPAKEWIPIYAYRGFFDVPRSFLIPTKDQSGYFLFDCLFDDKLDDYRTEYLIYEIPEIGDDLLAGDWAILPSLKTRDLGSIPITEMEFDESRRGAVNGKVYGFPQ